MVCADLRLKKFFLCLPIACGVYIAGLIAAISLFTSLCPTLIPNHKFAELAVSAEKNLETYVWFKTVLELLLILAFGQLCGSDSKKARYLFFKTYGAYIVILTALSLYLAIYPTKGMKLLSKKAILSYCREVEETEIFEFSNQDDCVDGVYANLLRNELIYLNVKFVVQLHFMQVIWTHFKNADLPISKGGCVPDETNRNIQMQRVALGRVQEAYLPANTTDQSREDTEEDEERVPHPLELT